ncbi:hypothetical protein Tco_0509155 [Tanacetum coccineum]
MQASVSSQQRIISTRGTRLPKTLGSDLRVRDKKKGNATRHGCKHDGVLPRQDTGRFHPPRNAIVTLAYDLGATAYEHVHVLSVLIGRNLKKKQMGAVHTDTMGGDGYLTEKELRQLHLDEEALKETLEEEAKAEKD